MEQETLRATWASSDTRTLCRRAETRSFLLRNNSEVQSMATEGAASLDEPAAALETINKTAGPPRD